MRKYRVDMESWSTEEFKTLEEAEISYEWYKDQKMGDGVTEDSYVELVYSDDDFEDYQVLKRADVIIDEERMKKSIPRDEGYDFDWWAKWYEETFQ